MERNGEFDFSAFQLTSSANFVSNCDCLSVAIVVGIFVWAISAVSQPPKSEGCDVRGTNDAVCGANHCVFRQTFDAKGLRIDLVFASSFFRATFQSRDHHISHWLLDERRDVYIPSFSYVMFFPSFKRDGFCLQHQSGREPCPESAIHRGWSEAHVQ
jgi:hypothetical protein